MTDAPTHPLPTDVRELYFRERLLGAALRMLPIRHGKHRMIDRLDRRRRIGGNGWVNVPFADASVVMDSSDLVGRHFMLLRDFDPEVTEVLVSAADAESESVLWDIGANQGACSYQLICRLPKCRVVAIEPQGELHALLNLNLSRIAPGRYETFRAGIGAQPDTLKLVIPDGNRGRASLCADKGEANSKTEQVAIMTPEEVLAQSTAGPPGLIKIDVEGYESVVIAALARQLEHWPTRVIVFEAHNEPDDDFKTIVKTLEGVGFDLYRITKTIKQTRLYPLTNTTQRATDFVALRRGVAFGAALEEMKQP